MITLLVIIAIPIACWYIYKIKYGVWLLDQNNRTRLGIAKKDVFGNKIAKFSFTPFDGWRGYAELKEDGSIGKQEAEYPLNATKIVKWKPYKESKKK